MREPPGAGARADVLRALGDARHALGHPEAAATLREAWDATTDPVVRARDALGLVTGLAERHRWPEAAEIGRAALAELGADVEPADHDLRETWLLLHAHLAESVRMDSTIGGDEPARLAALAARLSGATDGERWVLAMAAMMSSTDTAEGHARAADLVERAARGGDLPDNFPATGVISSLIRASRLDAAEDGHGPARQRRPGRAAWPSATRSRCSSAAGSSSNAAGSPRPSCRSATPTTSRPTASARRFSRWPSPRAAGWTRRAS